MDRAGVYDRLDSLFHYFYTHLDTFTLVFLILLQTWSRKNRKQPCKVGLKWRCCLLGEEPESQHHGHGSVLSGWLSAGQGGRTEFHAQTQGTRVDYYFFVTSINMW